MRGVRNCTQLRMLQAYNNDLRTLVDVRGLTQLQLLNVVNNDIRSTRSLHRLVNLTELYLDNNHRRLRKDSASALLQRNAELAWPCVAQRLLDVCIAFAPLDLPALIVLEIFDYLPGDNHLVPVHLKWHIVVAVKQRWRQWHAFDLTVSRPRRNRISQKQWMIENDLVDNVQTNNTATVPVAVC